MSARFFFDSSALIKLYHQELGTERVEEIFTTDVPLVISELAVVELHSTLARKVRTGEIPAESCDEAVRNFEQDCADRFDIEPLTSAVAGQAKALLSKHARQRALRSLDALQLASFSIVRARGEATFVSADGHLCGIAGLEGFSVVNPEQAAS